MCLLLESPKAWGERPQANMGKERVLNYIMTSAPQYGHFEIVLVKKNTGVLQASTCFQRIKTTTSPCDFLSFLVRLSGNQVLEF